MKGLTPIVFILVTAGLLPEAAAASDAEGCQDLKLFPRLQGCVIVECSAKQHDSFDGPLDTSDGSGSPIDAYTNSLVYSCPAGDLQQMKRDFGARLHKAGYQTIGEDKADPANPGLTARKGSQWVQWSASSEDSGTSYSLATAVTSDDKVRPEACAPPPEFSGLKHCEMAECASKSEDSVAMRTAQKEETPLTGNVQKVTLACSSVGAAQAFSSVEGELRASGSQILFSDRERPETGWMTGRAGKRWVELVSTPDGESVSYALTVVTSAEELTAVKPEPAAVPVPTPSPEPAPAERPVETAAVVVPQAAAAPQAAAPARVSAPVTAPIATFHPVFLPPRPIVEVPIEPTHDRIFSVQGEVVINMLVDVSEDGAVIKAVLTGRITGDVLKLESAALDAVAHWRFEPARQDGRIVASVKIPVQMRFRGRPWRF